jgi:protein-S-isoprenylcysteine O-methyltransferase Ste14
MNEGVDSPGVRFPPPLIYVGFFLAGWVCRVVLPRWQSTLAGIVIAVLSIAFASWATAQMLRARTHIIPHKPATTLVATGPYRFTRNPMYVSMAMAYVSASVWTGSMTSLVLLPIVLLTIDRAVIAREERYLERTFGDAYRDYRARVRRWV